MRRLTLALAGILALVALMPAKAQLTVWKNGEALYVMKYDIADSITFSAVDAFGGEIPDESEAVDLGLPSGTLWAPWNIGAKSATEVGSYFAWGETTSKTSYTSDNYKHSTDAYNFIKYNGDDGLTTL